MARLILLVDPDSDGRAIVRTYLEHHGYEVVESSTTEDGLAQVREQAPDLIIGEFPLDGLGGSPFTKAVREELDFEGPILSVTARARPQDIEAALVESTAVLLKPIHPAKVLEEVERLLDDE